MMRIVKPFCVITSKYEVLSMGYESVPGMRLMWVCSDLNVYVKGPLHDKLYEQAANLAMQECCSRNIRPSLLRSVNRKTIRPIETQTKRMF